jgi:hypothetical protein
VTIPKRVTIPEHRRYRNPEYYFLINIESVMQ